MNADALAEIVADPARLGDLPEEELADVVADLERLKAKAWTRLHRPPMEDGDKMNPAPNDRMLNAEAVADVLDVDTRYVYDHADDWPFTRRLSSRKLRFSERGLYRWLETRP